MLFYLFYQVKKSKLFLNGCILELSRPFFSSKLCFRYNSSYVEINCFDGWKACSIPFRLVQCNVPNKLHSVKLVIYFLLLWLEQKTMWFNWNYTISIIVIFCMNGNFFSCAHFQEKKQQNCHFNGVFIDRWKFHIKWYDRRIKLNENENNNRLWFWTK